MRERINLYESGFSLIEPLLAGALFVMVAGAFTTALLYGEENSKIAGQRGRATFYAQEGIEAIRGIRNTNFSSLTDGTYGVSRSQSSGLWQLVSGNTSIGPFTRTITISTVDSKIKDVTSVVTWQQNGQRNGQVQIQSRISNWKTTQ